MFTIYEKKALLQLFNVIVAEGDCDTSTTPLINTGVIVMHGNKVCTSISEENAKLLYDMKSVVADEWEDTFHKTWEKVAETPEWELVAEQCIHYFSTYGLESLGLEANPWVPAEKIFDGVDVKPSVEAFTIVQIVSPAEAINLVANYCKNVRAVNRNYSCEIISMMEQTDIKPEEITSNELKCARYKQLGTVPEDGQEFLRYVVYTVAGSSMIIKNKELIEAIKLGCRYCDDAYAYFKSANLENLAKIFFRYKPIFLAFKANKDCRPYINKIRRMADKLHEPMSPYTVQNISNLVINEDTDGVRRVVSNCNTRKLINLINFANNKSDGPRSFTIRNGRGFITDTQSSLTAFNKTQLTELLLGELVDRCVDKLAGKIYYIPDYISYAVPTSEKQLIGNIPFGSNIRVTPTDGFCMAIHWDNFEGRRTDIDLHMCSEEGKQYGWNSSYKSQLKHILFSGDMTDATNGATEAFSFVPEADEKYILTVNNYTGCSRVPFKFLITDKGFNKVGQGAFGSTTRCCDVADALFSPVPVTFDDSNDMTLGILSNLKFYFYSGKFGSGIIPNSDRYRDAVISLDNKLSSMLQLRSLLKCAGATVFTTESELEELDEEAKKNVIDLSPAMLTEQSILSIVDGFDNQ